MIVRAKCIRDCWDGKSMLYRMGNEYQINTDAPWAKHFEWAEKSQETVTPKPARIPAPSPPVPVELKPEPPSPRPISEKEINRRREAGERMRRLAAERRAARTEPGQEPEPSVEGAEENGE